jgi:two-component system chemotaxis response regulator CheB
VSAVEGGRPAGVVVVVGASAGGVEALCRLVQGLPGGLEAAVLVVLHLSPTSSSVLPRILNRSGPLPASHVEDGERLVTGRIYVAPPDHHLLVEDGRARLWRGPRENGLRPAIDPLFRSAASEYGPAAIGVVLSGMLDDGTAGLIEMKRAGALTMAQDPTDTPFPSMPASAGRFAHPDQVATADELADIIAAAVTRLASMPARTPPYKAHHHGGSEVTDLDSGLRQISGSCDPPEHGTRDQAGQISPLTCPECGGTLWERHDGTFVYFRCRVGHAYGADSLEAAQLESLEQSLWAAVVALEERADLCLRLAGRIQAEGASLSARSYEHQSADARRRAHLVRQAITKLSQPVQENGAGSGSVGPGISGEDDNYG